MYEPGEGLANEETSLDFNSTGDRKVTVDGVVGPRRRNGSYG